MENYYVRHTIDHKLNVQLYERKDSPWCVFILKFNLRELRQIIRYLGKKTKNYIQRSSDMHVQDDLLSFTVGYSCPKATIKVNPYLRKVFEEAIDQLGVVENYTVCDHIDGNTVYVRNNDLTVKFYDAGDVADGGGYFARLEFTQADVDELFSSGHCRIQDYVFALSNQHTLTEGDDSAILIKVTNSLKDVLEEYALLK
jgi:hypothetical protein